MAQDFYDILSISKSATDDEIKKAYRKLAVKYHPDKNPDDKEAEEKFKEVSNAYETLKDPEQRSMYDQVGHDAFTQRGRGGGRSSQHVDPFDLFSQVFSSSGGGGIFEEFFGGGGARQRNRPQQGADLLYNLRIEFEDAVFGIDKTIEVTKDNSCDTCSGSGSEKGSSKTTCKQCGGAGQVNVSQGFFNLRQTCNICSGTGEVIEKPCKTCRGSGLVEKTEKIEIHIPAGVDTGSRLRVSGKGAPGARGGRSGDLYVALHVDDHDFFEREGVDLYIDVPIDYVTAVIGGTIDVPTLSGIAKLKIPAGTQNGGNFRLRNKGVPSLRGQGRGNQFVKVRIEVPRKLNKEQEKVLKEFSETCTEKTHPDIKEFGDVIKRYSGK
ncbi:molecular chaperone DnaJ [bacterium AH-315-E10]|nr:molecular chaperone DnaJ [bacterium AH-315-E10]